MNLTEYTKSVMARYRGIAPGEDLLQHPRVNYSLLSILSNAEFMASNVYGVWKKLIFHGKGPESTTDKINMLAGFSGPSEEVDEARNIHLLLGIFGILEEAGEIAGVTFQIMMQGSTPELKEKLKLEMGDLLFYVTLISEKYLGMSVGDVFEANKVKLEKRWPNGFKFEGEK